MAFSTWLLLGGSVAYWGLQLFARPLPMPAAVQPAGAARPPAADLSRLLGATPAEAAAPEVAVSTRLRLLGVVAPRNARAVDAGEGVALIDVDGVARTVRVGAVVDGELRLLRVEARSVSLGLVGRAPSLVLEIGPMAAPATGALAPAAPSPVVLGGNPQGAEHAVGLPAVQVPPPAVPMTQGQPPYKNNDAQAL